jgi:hypothetical protein
MSRIGATTRSAFEPLLCGPMDEIDSGPCFVFIVGVVLSLETVLLSNPFVSSWIEGHVTPDTSHTRSLYPELPISDSSAGSAGLCVTTHSGASQF